MVQKWIAEISWKIYNISRVKNREITGIRKYEKSTVGTMDKRK